MSISVDASRIVGEIVKGQEDREIGRIISFLIDSSGQVEEVLVENMSGRFDRYPIEMLKIGKEGVSLASNVEQKMSRLSARLPVMQKKREILENLSEKKVIPPQIYDNLKKEFDKTLKEMKGEAQGLLENMDKQVKEQDEYVRTLQLARAYLEIEHGIGAVTDEVYQASILSLLREVKNAQQSKINLLRVKDEVSAILMEKKVEPIEQPEPEPAVETEESSGEATSEPANETQEIEKAIPVRVSEE